MNTLKIGIVEDDLIIALALSEMLTSCGYFVTSIARRYTEAIALLEDEHPDLLLIDVKINGTLDGIEVAKTINEQFRIPFIFLTANSDFGTINRAKDVKPSAFLSKPVTKQQLFAAIEIAAATHNAAHTTQQTIPVKDKLAKPGMAEALFLKEGASFRKVLLNEILLAETEENYVRLRLISKRTMLVRMTLTDFFAQLPEHQFTRIHRCYIASLAHVAQATVEEITLDDGTTVPLSRSYREAVMQQLGITR